MFDVELTLPRIETLGPDTQVVFHAINKSGSEAVSNVMHAAFARAGYPDRLHSHFRMPIDQEEFIRRVDTHVGGGLFIDHYLYGWVRPRPRRVMITQFRHPLPRILSAYQWLKSRHERTTGMPFESLESFVESTRGTAHCLVLQFGVNWKNVDTKVWFDYVARFSAAELYQRSLDALDREIFALGIAEHFEESLFLYARLCGLAKLPPWVRDQRNPDRTLSTSIPASTVRLIEQVLELDYRLYDHALDRFWAQFESASFGASLQAYKAVCAPQYRDRIS